MQDASSKSMSIMQSSKTTSTDDHEGTEFSAQEPVVVYKNVYCIKSKTTKTFYLHLYSGKIYQFQDNIKKKYHFSDMRKIEIPDEEKGIVMVDIKKDYDVTTTHKWYKFNNPNDAQFFKKYVESYNKVGHVIRHTFDEIDQAGTKNITPNILTKVLIKNGFKYEGKENELRKWFLLNDGNGEKISFKEYYNVVMENLEVACLKDCLKVWKEQSDKVIDSGGAINSDKIIFVDSQGQIIPILSGETVLNKYDQVCWKLNNSELLPGIIYFTDYRVVFVRFHSFDSISSDTDFSSNTLPPNMEVMTVPLSYLFKLKSDITSNSITVNTKDNRIYFIEFPQFDRNNCLKSDAVCDLLTNLAFIHGKVEPSDHLFCFKYNKQFVSKGWNFGAEADYKRLGLLDCKEFRYFDNSQWHHVDTYPRYLVVPAAMQDDEIHNCMLHRSKHRFPVVIYRHSNGTVLTRSSQPLIGIDVFSSHSAHFQADQRLLNYYRTTSSNNSVFEVFDCRRYVAAQLNKAGGGGTEDVAAYNNTIDIHFCDIENIHVMRSCYSSLGELLRGELTSDTHKKLEENGWMKHTRQILLSSVKVVEKILAGSSVLVHCSDGWDRTAQLCSMAQLMLDPYYRTIEGLAMLVEKDWCSFGHKFQERCGHGQDSEQKGSERSPVFVQFIETLFQVLRQFPTAFEYTERLLLFLANHLNSALFGNFLGNSDKQRNIESGDYEVVSLTKSIWSYVLDYRGQFSNSNFKPTTEVLFPSTHMLRISLWEQFHLRWDETAHTRPNPVGDVWLDDWGVGLETTARLEEDFGHTHENLGSTSTRALTISGKFYPSKPKTTEDNKNYDNATIEPDHHDRLHDDDCVSTISDVHENHLVHDDVALRSDVLHWLTDGTTENTEEEFGKYEL